MVPSSLAVLRKSGRRFRAASCGLMVLVTQGAPKPLYMPAGYLKTRDGAVSLSTMRQEHYQKLCACLGREDLLSDQRFAEKNTRISNGRQLMAELENETRQYPTADLLQRLHAAGVFVERIQSYGEWMEDEHVKQADAYALVDSGSGGSLPVVGIPGLPAPVPESPCAQAARVGQHSAQVLGELGFDVGRTEQLRQQGVVR